MKLNQTVFVLIFFSGIIPHCRSTRSEKLDWKNPCKYRSRSVREARSLKIQLKIALQESKTINATLTKLYKYGDTKDKVKINITTTKNLKDFYRDFYYLGKKTEKAINQIMITNDNQFNHTIRVLTLTKMRDMTVSIMCELFDAIKKKPILFVNNKKSNIQQPSKIQNRVGLTEARSIDNILSLSFNKLILGLRKTLRKRNNRRKTSPQDGEDRKKRRRKKSTSSKKC